ncbi:MAG: UDP-N-acetylmuramyl-tripeptide synthetase [Patescibacteria group bacterium]
MFQKLKNYLWHLPRTLFWQTFYLFPQKSLVLIGVTGTDGKTSTCNLIHQILSNANINVKSITTINSPGLHTTSNFSSKTFFQLLKQYQKDGVTHVICEATSHALDQFRYFGCHFTASVITNLSHEHLDYHRNMGNYLKAKSRLFCQSKYKILNADDPYFPQLKKLLKKNIFTYSIKNPSNFQAKKINISPESVSFVLDKQIYISDSPYKYQIYNLLAGISLTQKLKINKKIIIASIRHFPETKGRREIVKNNFKINCIVDFAHTPNALFETLTALKIIYPNGKLICLFGATGGRDQSKRPLMGKIVSEIADVAIITADDTRNEPIDSINQQIISGINPKKIKQKKFQYHNIFNRQDAFNFAVKIANPGDTIIACGKGHELSILHSKTEYPWSETEAFKTAFRNRDQNV